MQMHVSLLLLRAKDVCFFPMSLLKYFKILTLLVLPQNKVLCLCLISDLEHNTNSTNLFVLTLPPSFIIAPSFFVLLHTKLQDYLLCVNFLTYNTNVNAIVKQRRCRTQLCSSSDLLCSTLYAFVQLFVIKYLCSQSNISVSRYGLHSLWPGLKILWPKSIFNQSLQI